MNDDLMSDFELTPPSVVRQAARDFAVALAETPQFKSFEQAAYALRHDQKAQLAMEAYHHRRKSLQGMLVLNAVGVEEQVELERLRQRYLAEPSVQAYLQAHGELVTICQAAADLLSRYIGVDYSAACGTSCCG